MSSNLLEPMKYVGKIFNYYANQLVQNVFGASIGVVGAQVLVGDFGGKVVRMIASPVISQPLIRSLIGIPHDVQALIERYVPHLTTGNYSKLLRGLRFALSNILTDSEIPYGTMGSKWRVDVIPVKEYFESLLSKKPSYALADERVPFTVIQLPKIQFSQELLQKKQYFSDLRPEQIFDNLDHYEKQFPEWVIRIKKIWNLLFLVEKIFTAIEASDFSLTSPENLADFNHAYNLLFDLDINVLDFFGKISQEITKELSKDSALNIFEAVARDDLWLSKYLGYYLGLILTQLGSTDNIVTFAIQGKEVFPHILGEVALKLKTIINAIETKGPVSLQPQQIEELKNETEKILADIKQFLEMQQEGRANFLEIMIAFLQFISKPDRLKVFKFFQYLASEHQALCLELMRYIKYAVFPAVIGLVEDFENSAMLEPGSLVFYVENYSQMFFEDMVYYLNFQSDEDMKTLYTFNWVMIRQSQIWKKLSILQQQEEKLKFDLSIIESAISPAERFKSLYPYFVQVDSGLAEKIRYQLQKNPGKFNQFLDALLKTDASQDSIWRQIAPKVKGHIQAKLIQSQDQIQLMRSYVETLSWAKRRKVCYFEILPETKLVFGSLTDTTQREIEAAPPSEQEQRTAEALVQLSIQKLHAIFATKAPDALFKGAESVIKFADDYYLVQKSTRSSSIDIHHLPGILLPYQASNEKSVFLPGKVLKNLGHYNERYLPIVQSKENSRFTLDLDAAYVPTKENFTLDQLSSNELHLYSIAWKEKINKIKRAQPMLKEMIKLIQSSSRSANALLVLKYYYCNLQGVFQYFLSPQVGQSQSEDRFITFQEDFHQHHFEADGLLEKCQEISRALSQQLKTAEGEIELINQQYKAQYSQEKQRDFQLVSADKQAGYLLRTTQYSSFFRQQIENLHAFIEKYGSSSLKILLAKNQNSTWEMYDPNLPFPETNWDHLPAITVEICYLHNCLYYLQKMYWRFERQKKYALGDSSANQELVTRVMSIVDFFTFFNFAFYSKSTGTISDSLQQFVKFKPVFQFLKRYAQIYDLRDVEQNAFLNGPLIANQMITDLFSRSAISDYLISGRIDKQLEDKITALFTNRELIINQFKSFDKLPLFATFRQERLPLKLKINDKKEALNLLKEQILSSTRTYSELKVQRASYATQNKLLAELMKVENVQQKEFDQLLADRMQLILHLIEKSQQGLVNELKPIEKIILKLISRKSLDSSEEKLLKQRKKCLDKALKEKKIISQVYYQILLKYENLQNLNHQWQLRTKQILKKQDILSKKIRIETYLAEPVLNETEVDRILSVIGEQALRGENLFVAQEYHELLQEIDKSFSRNLTPSQQLLRDLVYKRPGQFFVHNLNSVEALHGLTEMESLLLKMMRHQKKPEKLSLTDSELDLIQGVFEAGEEGLNPDEYFIRKFFHPIAGGYQFYPIEYNFGELLYKKMVTRKRLDLPLDLNRTERTFLKEKIFCTGSTNSIFHQLLEYQNGEFCFKSHKIDFCDQYALELKEARISYPFKPVHELTFEEILKLPQVQMSMMRSDVYEAYCNYSKKKTEAHQQIFMGLCKEVITQSLQELRVIEFRNHHLKDIHLASKKFIGQYELYAKGHQGFMGRNIISVLSTLLSSLRQSIVTLRQKTELNISSIKDVMGAPVLAEFDALEIRTGLKPGAMTAFLEKQIDAFVNEFSKQISSSPLYTPLILADRSVSLRRRLEVIEAIPNSQVYQEYLKAEISRTEKAREKRNLDLIFKQFKSYTTNYCRLMIIKHLFMTNPTLISQNVFNVYLQKHLINMIQVPGVPGKLRADIFSEIQSQEDVQFDTHSPKDDIFRQRLRPILMTYMTAHSHHFKKLDDLMNTLDAYDGYLMTVSKDLKRLNEELLNKSLTWGQYFSLQLELFYRSKLYYALNLDLINRQRVVLSELKTCLRTELKKEYQGAGNIANVITAFAEKLNDPALRQTLDESTSTNWYLGKFLFYLIYYIFNTFIFLLNCVLPHSCQIRFMTPKHIQYQEDMQYTLGKQAKDVKCDHQTAFNELFISPQHHSPSTSRILR